MQLTNFLLPLVLTSSAVSAASLPLRITSFNIRYAATSLETNEVSWWNILCGLGLSSCRRDVSRKYIAGIASNAPSGSAVVFGLQEVLNNQLSDILDHLGDKWTSIGVGRDNGATSGEYNPILYRSDVLNLIYSVTKWLSPTPNEVSYGWGGGSRRIVTIGVFEHASTGKRFIHANTHLDNVSNEARVNGIKVVVDQIKAVQSQYGPLGVTLTGDFNSDPNGEAYITLAGLGYVTDLWNAATHVGTNQLTYTGFSDTGKSRIDFVWFGPSSGTYYTTNKIEFLSNKDSSTGIYISDHRAVVGDVTLN